MRDRDEATTSVGGGGTSKEMVLQTIKSGDRVHRPVKRIIGQQVSKIHTYYDHVSGKMGFWGLESCNVYIPCILLSVGISS